MFTSKIISIIVLISRKGVTNTTDTLEPCVFRNLHTKFHMKFNQSDTTSFMA